jgi:hypothetical protein
MAARERDRAVQDAIERAKAGYWVLEALEGEDIQLVNLFDSERAMPRNEQEAEDITWWIRRWALDAIREAVREIESASSEPAANTGES